MFLLITGSFILQPAIGEIPINEKPFGAQVTSAAWYIMVHHIAGFCVQRSTCILFSTKRREQLSYIPKKYPENFLMKDKMAMPTRCTKVMIKSELLTFNICTILDLIKCRPKYVK